MSRKETKLQRFERLYEREIKEGSWITKDDMTDKEFFPHKGSNGKDIRFIKSKYKLKEHRVGNRIPKFKILGKKEKIETRSIRTDIRSKLKDKRCPVTNTSSNTEIDHKNGRYNNPRVLDTKTQTLEDFQVLSKTVNNAKREACLKCQETGKKFDARKLGFLFANLNGEDIHDGTPDGCVGCYYYDVELFIHIHRDYLKKNIRGTQNDFKDFFESFDH